MKSSHQISCWYRSESTMFQGESLRDPGFNINPGWVKTTRCFIWFKKSVITFERLPDISFCFNLKRRHRANVTKCFGYIKNDASCLEAIIKWLINIVIHNSWLMHKSPGLYPNWLWEISSFAEKNSNILL